jgi:hypothetical protein
LLKSNRRFATTNRDSKCQSASGMETRIGLFSSTQDHAQADRRTLAGISELI